MWLQLNNAYILRNDGNRSIVAARKNVEGDCIPFWISRIHPAYAMLLSLFSSPVEQENAYAKCSEFLDIPIEKATFLIDSFINESSYFTIDINNHTSVFPPHLLLKTSEFNNSNLPNYSPEDFIYSPPIDLQSQRLNIGPLGLVWMVSDHCVTDCVYCYAQKNHAKNFIGVDTIEKMLQESKELNILDISLTGGEFFLNPHWEEILNLLCKYGFQPQAISTKMPLSRRMIDAIGRLNGTIIQLSLDSINREALCDSLNVGSDYLDKVKNTIYLLEEKGIAVQIGTVITRRTSKIADLQDIYDFISKRKNVIRWTIRIGFPSLYSHADYSEWKASDKSIEEIENWYETIKGYSTLQIEYSNENKKQAFTVDTGSQDFPGARCSANYTHCVILPDGNVTICEQLYWHPQFLIGNLKNNTLKEIWQSAKAKELACIPQNKINTTSPCHKCDIYDRCLKFPNKCYTDVLKAYGMDCWDYPDIRCKFAPAFVNRIFE